jgi:hypothetical protein
MTREARIVEERQRYPPWANPQDAGDPSKVKPTRGWSLISYEIRLQGSIGVGGVCELPRLEAQLTEVALQFDTDGVDVWIDGRALSEALDLSG